jgi:hypothetical protein
MRFDDLAHFIERDMRMSHIYQPVMLYGMAGAERGPQRNRLRDALQPLT